MATLAEIAAREPSGQFKEIRVRRTSTGKATILYVNDMRPETTRKKLTLPNGETKYVYEQKLVPAEPYTEDHFPTIANLSADDWEKVII